MGLLNISRVCLAVFFVSAITPTLAADPPVPRGNVSVTVNPTTGYYSSTSGTVRLPNGVSASPGAGGLPAVPGAGGLPAVSRYSGGLQQKIPMGITIDAIKTSAPLPVVVRATTQSVKTAATRCLTSARCNVGLMLAGAGLQLLLDKMDWIFEDSKIVKATIDETFPHIPVDTQNMTMDSSGYFNSQDSQNSRILVGTHVYPNGSTLTQYCNRVQSRRNFATYAGGSKCWYYNDTKLGPNLEARVNTSVSASDIEDAVNSNYTPEPSDWPALTPELKLSDIEITSAPTLQGKPVTTTIYDADGNPHEITETNTWYDFDIRDNKSSQPALDMKTRQETKTYKNGALTGTTTTESTSPGGSAGGGGGKAPTVDIPTDCEFMPTVCAFIDWVKNDDTPEDPDLSALIDDRDFTETYSISGGSKQCPADYEFTVDFVGRTYGLSFEPACDFASKMYYFLMAAAYIFAAYITVGVARHG